MTISIVIVMGVTNNRVLPHFKVSYIESCKRCKDMI